MAKTRSSTHFNLHFRVRPLILRFFVYAISLAATAVIVPHIFFSGDYRILSWLLISAVFGLLNAFLKPLFQIIMLPLIFVSYGLVVVVINTFLLYALSFVFPARFHMEHLLWAIVGGLVCGLLEGLLQNLFGLNAPIVEGGSDALKAQIARHNRGLLAGEVLAVTDRDVAEPLENASAAAADRPEGGQP